MLLDHRLIEVECEVTLILSLHSCDHWRLLKNGLLL